MFDNKTWVPFLELAAAAPKINMHIETDVGMETGTEDILDNMGIRKRSQQGIWM